MLAKTNNNQLKMANLNQAFAIYQYDTTFSNLYDKSPRTVNKINQISFNYREYTYFCS